MEQMGLRLGQSPIVRKLGVARARLPTNTTTSGHAIHRWFNFIAGFAPEYVGLCCGKTKGAVLLDPFAGCGTALVEARMLGMSAIGYEPHPFFARIARAKATYHLTSDRIGRIERAVLQGISHPVDPSALAEAPRRFLGKLFAPKALEALLGARRCLEQNDLGSDDLAFLILSRALDHCSTAQTDGIYKAPTSKKRAQAPAQALGLLLQSVRDDLVAVPDTHGMTFRVHESSSESMRDLPDASVDIVVTSPPYLNNFDFAEMTRMYLYFWGMCDSWGDITTRVRSNLIVNTTTALKGHREIQHQYRREIPRSVALSLDDMVASLLVQRRSRAGKKEYDLLVYPYFAQMTRVLRECYRVLQPGGSLNIAVADAALYGVHVSTPQLLASICADLGFSRVTCEKLRSRGERWILAKRDGSPTGLGEYHISALR